MTPDPEHDPEKWLPVFGKRSCSTNAALITHGGDLGDARRLFPSAPEPFIDLSTGINPHSYPLPQLLPEVFARLPDAAALARLTAAAARAYGAPSPRHVVAAPGTQSLLPLTAALVPPGRAAVLGPTYAEHVRVAALVGHRATEVAEVGGLTDADLAIVVNPNNPDGRIVGRETLLSLAERQKRRGGLLVVDEAFMDVASPDASLGGHVAHESIVVLRSFGKFYGLAGVRLGFALAAPDIAARLKATLGPWAVAGPAIAIGEAALGDLSWAQPMRERLGREAQQLDAALMDAGIAVVGGTSLFRLVRTPAAGELFCHLGCAGLFVRRFAEQPSWLRLGLPPDAAAWARLHAALAAFPR